MIGCWRFKYHF